MVEDEVGALNLRSRSMKTRIGGGEVLSKLSIWDFSVLAYGDPMIRRILL